MCYSEIECYNEINHNMFFFKWRLRVIWAARVWFLFQGISTSLVLATINGYLKSFGAHTDYMGYVMAGYAFGGIIAAPMFGKIADKTKNGKIVLLLSMTFQVVSYILYLYFQNENVLLLARILAGIGFGADGAIVGEISRNLSEKEAPSKIALLTGCHEIGFFLGPILLVGVSRIRIYLPDVAVNAHNAIGFFCAIIWMVAFIITTFSYDPPISSLVLSSLAKESEPLLTAGSSGKSTPFRRPPNMEGSFVQILICIYTYFAYMVFCAVLDTSVTPLTDRFFGFTDIENGIIFLSLGFVSAIMYFVMQISYVRKLVPDYMMIPLGSSAQFISSIGMAISMYFMTFRAFWIYFVQGLFLFIFSSTLPFLNVGCISMLSKFSPESELSYLQGIRSSSGRIAKVLKF